MQKIKVQIGWLDNYGAGSDEVPGFVAIHKTLEGVKKGLYRIIGMAFGCYAG